MDEAPEQLEQARETLRSWTRGILRFDEHVRPVRYVIAADGRLVMPAMVAMLSTLDTALHVPDEDPDGLQLLVELHEVDPDSAEGALIDRWRIYHGEPNDVRWAVLDIDFGRFRGASIDGEALVVPNPLAEAEPKLCSMVNTEHDAALKALLASELQIAAATPLLVGVDPTGLDVRADQDVVRVSHGLGIDPKTAAGSLLSLLDVV